MAVVREIVGPASPGRRVRECAPTPRWYAADGSAKPGSAPRRSGFGSGGVSLAQPRGTAKRPLGGGPAAVAPAEPAPSDRSAPRAAEPGSVLPATVGPSAPARSGEPAASALPGGAAPPGRFAASSPPGSAVSEPSGRLPASAVSPDPSGRLAASAVSPDPSGRVPSGRDTARGPSEGFRVASPSASSGAATPLAAPCAPAGRSNPDAPPVNGAGAGLGGRAGSPNAVRCDADSL